MSVIDDLMRERTARVPAAEFRGASEADVAALETRLGVRFPTVYHEYLLVMGREPGGVARGSDIRFGCLHLLTEEMRAEAAGAGIDVDADAVAIFAHQGYDYVYFRASEAATSPDPPLYRLRAPERTRRRAFDSVSEYLARLFRFDDIAAPGS
jgi:hypothetical protein